MPDPFADRAGSDEELGQEPAKPEGVLESGCRGGLCRTAVDRQHGTHQLGAAVGHPERNGRTGGLAHDHGIGGAEAVERRADAVGLRGEGVVHLGRMRRGAKGEWLDDDAAVTERDELGDHVTEAECPAEDAWQKHDRLARAGACGAEDLQRSDLDFPHDGRVEQGNQR